MSPTKEQGEKLNIKRIEVILKYYTLFVNFNLLITLYQAKEKERFVSHVLINKYVDINMWTKCTVYTESNF